MTRIGRGDALFLGLLVGSFITAVLIELVGCQA